MGEHPAEAVRLTAQRRTPTAPVPVRTGAASGLTGGLAGGLAGGAPGPRLSASLAAAVGGSAGVALSLQTSAGNQAVGVVVDQIARQALQRVAVKERPPNETLYNDRGTGGTAKAGQYGGTVSYDMSRNGDSGVTVTIKIQFLNQMRQGTAKPPGAPAGTPDLGDLIGKPTEIPTSDPDDRRSWCQNIVKEQVKPWNGHLTLVGEERNVFSANTPKRLPVTFNSVAVFGINDPHDQTIIVHPTTTKADKATGNPIDAGNYYLNKGNYTSDDSVIAAHEYGHLLGIDDEYSQSNEMMNALMHQAAPSGAPSQMAALDKKTVERMVLSSLKKPLLDQLGTTLPAVTDAFRAKQATVKTKMAAAARVGVKDAAVRDALEKNLTATTDAKMSSSIPRAVAFQTTANFSNLTTAEQGVSAGFSATQLSATMTDIYSRALNAADSAAISMTGVGDVAINVQPSVRSMTATGGAQAGNAAGVAGSTVGAVTPAAPGAGGAVGLPTIAPASSLTGQLAALPASWGTAGSAIEAGITPAIFAAKMADAVKNAKAATGPTPPGVKTSTAKARALYQQAYAVVTAMATDTCRAMAGELVKSVVTPVMAASVKDLESTIQSEVSKVMGTPASGVAALGPPNPQMAALVSHMKAQLDADKAASAGGGRTPLGSGKAAPDQNVTYSVLSLMGSSKTTGIRADQFNPVVRQFNDKLKGMWEKPFTAEVK